MKHTRMMKTTLLLSALALLGACQEKVAPELSNPASATGPTTPTTTTTASKDFFLTLGQTSNNVLPELLGYTLHKTNLLNTTACRVENTASTPETLDSTNDISCYLDAEELALNYNGFSVSARSDVGACEFIQAKPFFYWALQPGMTARQNGSAREVVFFKCDAQLYVDMPTAPIPTTYGTANGSLDTVEEACGVFFNLSSSSSSNFGALDLSSSTGAVTIEDNDVKSMCSFNYKDSDDNVYAACDEGSIVVHTVNVAGKDTDSDGVLDTMIVSEAATAETKCGGKVRNCMDGAGKDFLISELSSSDVIVKGKTSVVSQIPASAAGAYEMTIPSLFPKKDNIYYSNFMRQCSGVTNFGVRSSFSGAGLTSYDHNVISAFSALGMQSISSQETDSYGLDVIKLADHPLQAGYNSADVSGFSLSDTRRKYAGRYLAAQPNYVFECLDKAFEVKARISLIVREWNRTFSPTTENLQLVSDSYKSLAGTFVNRPKMEAGSPVGQAEFLSPSSVTDYSYNDYSDWDDWLLFDNTANANSSTCNSGTTTDAAAYPLKSQYWFPDGLNPN